jgi:hypothetical protein
MTERFLDEVKIVGSSGGRFTVMNRLALLASLWLAGTSCGAATGLDESQSTARSGNSHTSTSGGASSDLSGGEHTGTNQIESGGTSTMTSVGGSASTAVAGSTSFSGGGSSIALPTPLRDCEHTVNDGGGGAHTVAVQACCQCGWPVDGPLCSSVMHILPFWHGADDVFYYRCIGGEVPFCIMDHLDTCAAGFPPECDEAYANQVACISHLE